MFQFNDLMVEYHQADENLKKMDPKSYSHQLLVKKVASIRRQIKKVNPNFDWFPFTNLNIFL